MTAPFSAVQGIDRAVQAWMLAHQYAALDRIFFAITTLGGIVAMRATAAIGAIYLAYRRQFRASVVLVAAAIAADVLFTTAKRSFARPRPQGLGAGVDSSGSFPSGHGTMAAAVCGTLAYLLWREGFVRGRVALTVAAMIPLLVGISRVYLNVHWASDVLGGWLAGLLVAAVAATSYDRFRRPTPAGITSISSSVPLP